MAQPTFVVQKEPQNTTVVSLDLSPLMISGETLATVSVAALASGYETTVQVGALPLTGGILPVSLIGGAPGKTFGFRITATASPARQIIAYIAVTCTQPQFSDLDHERLDPSTFQTTIGTLAAGDAALGNVTFTLDPSATTAGAAVSWSVISSSGGLLSSGNAFQVKVLPGSFYTSVAAQAVVSLPSNIPESNLDEAYQVRWSLAVPGSPVLYSYEPIQVVQLTTYPLGAIDAIEQTGDPINLEIVLDSQYDNLSYEVFADNTSVFPQTAVLTPGSPAQLTRVSSGWLASVTLPAGLPASLDPYLVSWRYFKSSAPGQVFRTSAKLIVASPSILMAVEDTRMAAAKARTTLFGFNDMIFDPQTIVSWLRRGRDMFNAAGGTLTTFDMSMATGGIREYWLGYSEAMMLQAQSLAEAEKAFNFSGQAISLEVDRSQAYATAADAILNRLTPDVRALKLALKTSGLSGGNGDASKQPGNRPRLGITLTPATQTRYPAGYRVGY